MIKLLLDLWRRMTYRAPGRPHPHASAGLAEMRSRYAHSWLDEWRDQ